MHNHLAEVELLLKNGTAGETTARRTSRPTAAR